MQYSIKKIATFALLGFSNLAAFTRALPSGVIIDDNSVSISTYPRNIAARAKLVPRLNDYDYEVHKGPGFAGRPVRYTVTKNGVLSNVDEIWIDATRGIITIENALNAEDKTSNKLQLSDIAVSLFVFYGEKQPSDITQIVFSNVVESDSNSHEILNEALTVAGWARGNPVTITATPTSSPYVESTKQGLFATIEDMPFAKSVRWMANDFGIPLTTSWTVSGSPTKPTLTASLR